MAAPHGDTPGATAPEAPARRAVIGLLTFVGLYGFALWSTKRDPQMLPHPAVLVPIQDSVRRGEARPRGRRSVVVLKVRRILRDYQDAGSVNSLLALWGFVDDETFLTKAGDVGVVYRLAGADYECLDQAQRRDIVHRFEAALRLLDPACRVHQYLCKRRIDPIAAAPCRQRLAHEAIQRRTANLNARREALYDLDLYLVLVYEGLRSHATSSCLRGISRDPRAALRQWLSSSAVLKLLDADLDRAVAQLHHKAAAFEVQLADSVRLWQAGGSENRAFR